MKAEINPEKVDLHLHSRYSDGSDTPTELIQKAKDIGLEAIALTDHDTIEGWEEWNDAGKANGIKTISGIELSLEDIDGATNVHLLGYFPYGESRPAVEELGKYSLSRVEARNRRLPQMAILLRNCGLQINEEEVFKEAGDGNIITRAHVANAVCRLNPDQFKNMREVFEKYLMAGKPAYLPIEKKMHLKQAITWIKSLGGIAILAHPGVSNDPQLDPTRGERILISALEYDADGGEGDYVYHKNDPYSRVGADSSVNQPLCQKYIQILTKRGKIVTSGSDYHGKNKKIEMGEQGGRVYNAQRLWGVS